MSSTGSVLSGLFKNAVLRVKTLECSLNCNYIKPANPKEIIGNTDAEAPMLWPPDVKSRLIGKDPDAEKD